MAGYFDIDGIGADAGIQFLNTTTPAVEVNNATNGVDLGIDLKGFGTLASLVGGFMAQRDDKKYKKELLKREDARIARDRKRQDNYNTGMKEVWK